MQLHSPVSICYNRTIFVKIKQVIQYENGNHDILHKRVTLEIGSATSLLPQKNIIIYKKPSGDEAEMRYFLSFVNISISGR